MTLIGFAQSGHPVLQQPDVVFLPGPRGTEQGQNPLGVLPPTTIHFREFEQHFDFTERAKTSDENNEIFLIFMLILVVLLTSSTPPSNKAGSETQRPQTDSR